MPAGLPGFVVGASRVWSGPGLGHGFRGAWWQRLCGLDPRLQRGDLGGGQARPRQQREDLIGNERTLRPSNARTPHATPAARPMPRPAKAVTHGVVQNGLHETGNTLQFTRPTAWLEAAGPRFAPRCLPRLYRQSPMAGVPAQHGSQGAESLRPAGRPASQVHQFRVQLRLGGCQVRAVLQRRADSRTG